MSGFDNLGKIISDILFYPILFVLTPILESIKILLVDSNGNSRIKLN
jgi:hypothetical protein